MKIENVQGFKIGINENDITLYRSSDIIQLDTLHDWSIIQCNGDVFDNPMSVLRSFNDFANRINHTCSEVDSIARDGRAATKIVRYLNEVVSRVNGYIEMVEDYISNREYLGQKDVPDTSIMYDVAKRIRKTFAFYADCTTAIYRAGYFTAA